MVIVGVVLVLAYMAFVVAMIVRGDSADRKPTPWPRLEGFLLRPRARLVPLRARMAGLVGRKRADPAAGNESLRRPLEAYEAALNSALATVAALDPDFGARSSDRREFEEVAVQALVAAHSLRQLADAAGACADACEVAETRRRRDKSPSFSAARPSSPQHQLRESC